MLSCFASTTPCVECTWRRARSVRVHVSRRAHGMNEEGRGGKKREPRGLPLVPDSHGRELLSWQEDKRQGHSDASPRMAPRRTPPPFWWRFPVLSPLLSPLLRSLKGFRFPFPLLPRTPPPPLPPPSSPSTPAPAPRASFPPSTPAPHAAWRSDHLDRTSTRTRRHIQQGSHRPRRLEHASGAR